MKYRAKIKVFSDGNRQVILQKSLLGIIWFNMYVKTGNYSENIKKIVVDYPTENTSGSKCIETFKFIYNKSDKQLHPTV